LPGLPEDTPALYRTPCRHRPGVPHRTPWHRPPGQVCGAAQVSGCPAGRPPRPCLRTRRVSRAHPQGAAGRGSRPRGQGPGGFPGASPEAANGGRGLRVSGLAYGRSAVPSPPECARMGGPLAEPPGSCPRRTRDSWLEAGMQLGHAAPSLRTRWSRSKDDEGYPAHNSTRGLRPLSPGR